MNEAPRVSGKRLLLGMLILGVVVVSGVSGFAALTRPVKAPPASSASSTPS